MKLYIVMENNYITWTALPQRRQAAGGKMKQKKKWHWPKGRTVAMVNQVRFVALDINYEHLSLKRIAIIHSMLQGNLNNSDKN